MTTDNMKRDTGQAVEAAPTETQPRSRAGRMAAAAMESLPTLLVLAAIVGIAYWGHHTSWKAPKFSHVAGASTTKEKEDWCEEHGVQESRCIKCHPELVGANAKDWCPEHGVPESKCTICHPEILKTGVAGDWCVEHGVPESGCTLCHPEIAIKGEAPASETGATVTMASSSTQPSTSPSTAPAVSRPVPQGDEPQAAVSGKAVKDPKTCQTHLMRVQFASGESVRKAGVKLGQVVERPMSATFSANAEVDYNRTRIAQLSSPSAGKVWRVEKEVGQPVKQGEVLVLVDAAEVGRAKADLLQAFATLDLKGKTVKRLRTSAESGFRTDAELQEAEAAVKEARIRVFNAQQALINLGLSPNPQDLADLPERQNVQFMGLPPSLAEKLDPKTTTANLLPLVAPFDGVVIERNVVAGEVIEPSKPLMIIGDTRQMWVVADLPLGDAGRVALGQNVTFVPDTAADQSVKGVVSWISTAVDDQTRTVKVRANVENPDGRLLAHTFGRALITVRESPSVVAIPSEAIQWEGCCHIVFVRLTEDIFQTRKVKLGSKANGFTEVTIGLMPGEVIATNGSHVLKSEILKSALGAGCTDGH